jgi:hypothetical protein
MENCANSLRFIVISLLGFKLMENVLTAFGWLSAPNKNKKEKTRV